MNYLIAEQDASIEVRPVPQRDGGQKFAIDQLVNPGTVALRPGGLIEQGGLVAGQKGTSSDKPASLSLYKLIVDHMRKNFSKVKSYYLGTDASRLLDEGVRLTANPKSPVLYDLRRS
ncbi:MAG TPA: hypothetical protein VIT23_16085 [Terrimicrobiaceae bacterium]